MQINSVEPGRGVGWFVDGWGLFTKAVVMWIVMLVVLFIITIVLSIIPLLGPIALVLIMPLLVAGWMSAARKAEQGQEVEIGDLFVAFSDAERRGPLLVLAVIILVIEIILTFVVAGSLFGALGIGFGAMEAGVDPEAMGPAAAGGGFIVVLLAIVIGFLMYAAFAYAIPLVYFDKVAPVDAIKASFTGSIKNIVALIVATIVYLVLGIVATIPLGLGWLVLGPVAFCALYISYKDIFGTTP
jgi:uncharacterized membrane protein